MKRPRRNPSVDLDEDILYHGTSRLQAQRIVKEGLRPRAHGGGMSRHRTKTKTATFLTDSPAVAMFYADADDPAIIAFRAKDIVERLEPDYDDVGDEVKWNLKDVHDHMRDVNDPITPKVGMKLTEKQAREIQGWHESMYDDEGLPYIGVANVGGQDYLVALPWVAFPTREWEIPPEIYEDYEYGSVPGPGGLVTFDGRVRWIGQQFLLRGTLEPRYIHEVYLPSHLRADAMVIPDIQHDGFVDENYKHLTFDEAVDAAHEGRYADFYVKSWMPLRGAG